MTTEEIDQPVSQVQNGLGVLKKNSISNLKTVSIHEAGHAVIYHLHGHQIQYVTISESGDGFVQCETYKPTFGSINDLGNRLERYGELCLSGYCAELKFTSKRLNGRMSIQGTNENDIDSFRREMRKANEIIEKNLYGDFYFDLIQSSTRKLIAKKNIWNAILKLSDELMIAENYYIEGKRVHEILNQFVKQGASTSDQKVEVNV